jgi:FkbM family methyltransferase
MISKLRVSLASGSVLGRLARLPLRCIPRTMVLLVLSGPLRGSKWISGAADHGCWIGIYERAKQDVFAAHIGPGSVVFDVGAHVGFYTLLASVLAGSRGTVVAFEPSPANIAHLRAHIRLNNVENAHVIEAAVGEKDGTAWFKHGLTSTTGGIAETGDWKVQVVSLDSLVVDGNLRPPDVIKMDIEGAEAAALRGARQILVTHKPAIFLATHGPAATQDCCAFLTSIGYTVRPIDSPAGETSEFLASHPASVARRKAPSKRG